MKFFSLSLLLFVFGLCVAAQEKDTVRVIQEVKVVADAKKKIQTDLKMAVSVDEFLASSQHISFIKRGAYGWEPLLNNMGSERSALTIDGMHVFGACTDKMDPITSYVESNNLSHVDITSGQSGSLHGATIGGGIDLRRKSTPFGSDPKWHGGYQSGLEFNNRQFFNLGNVSYSDEIFVVDGSFSLRKAGNYYAGNGQEVNHSQYNKFNTALGLAYKTSSLSSIRVDAIYDKAKDVGFPALPMDLWLSRALITSVAYKRLFEEGVVKAWDSKVYYNAIEHYMDDTTRPENLVHMDMPGWSTTYGLLSNVNLKQDNYTAEIQLNAYNNVSIAEMRMYPQDRSNRTMFAYSWPWVTTRYIGLSMRNSFELTDLSRLHFGGAMGLNDQQAKYVEFNRIFYPEARPAKTRFLPNVHANYEVELSHFDVVVGAGYGHRAPSVSEAYGYYIYNSFDRYDYVGNPDLANEISYEINMSLGFQYNGFRAKMSGNYFHIKNYIVGRILSMGSPMNYQSVGVKGYMSLDYARLYNLSLQADYHIAHSLHWSGSVSYARAQDRIGDNLPFIRPLSYLTSLHFDYGKLRMQTSVNGDLAQVNFSPSYGEDHTPSYMIWNASIDYGFPFMKRQVAVQIGVENMLDKFYSTYADWGNIPRMGRNFFTSLKIDF